MINQKTALAFDSGVSDGFVKPALAWSATTPYHINETGASGITSNFWVGKPNDVKLFAQKLSKFYSDFYNDSDNFDEELDEYESISVAYWENDGIAMCADLCTSDQMYDVLPVEFFEEAEQKKLKHVLFNGNDNHPGLILKNADDLLSVEERISLAAFMQNDATIWITEDVYREEHLKGFSDEDIVRLKSAFQKY